MSEKTRTIIFRISAILLLVGAVLYLNAPHVAAYIFAIGAAGITICYMTVSSAGMDFHQRRLHRYNILSGILCIFASGLMFNQRKEWIICLAIATIFQTVSAFSSSKKKKK